MHVSRIKTRVLMLPNFSQDRPNTARLFQFWILQLTSMQISHYLVNDTHMSSKLFKSDLKLRNARTFPLSHQLSSNSVGEMKIIIFLFVVCFLGLSGAAKVWILLLRIYTIYHLNINCSWPRFRKNLTRKNTIRAE